MKPSLLVLSALSSVLLLANGCSSDKDDPPREAGSTDAGADGSSASVCIEDTMGVARDDSEICCPGLFKACRNVTMSGAKPCVCSTVACGTEANPPPPNVPCCPEVLWQDCSGAIGGPTICTCGPVEQGE